MHFILRFFVALVVLGTLSCATDGGVGGTGVSGITVIDGNIASNGSAGEIAAAAILSGGNAGIIVRVKNMDIEVITDDSGRFRLEGEIAGLVTLEFVEPDGTVSTLVLEVPAGGEIQLIDVRIDRIERRASAREISLIFEAVTQADAICDAADSGTLLVTDRSPAANSFTVLLIPETRLTEDDAAAPACPDFYLGRLIRIEGVDQGNAIVATRLRILRSRGINGTGTGNGRSRAGAARGNG